MAAVSTPEAPTRNAWTCPTCRHGSPDPRDETAHLDAHRQLGQFFREWDVAVANDRDPQPVRRSVAALLAALVAAVVLAAAILFWGFGRPTGTVAPSPATPVPGSVLPAPSVPDPVGGSPAPAPGPEAPATPDAVASSEPAAPASTPSVADVAAATATATATAAPASDEPVPAASVSAAADPAPVSPVEVVAPVPSPPSFSPGPVPGAHLLQICLPITCVAVG